MTFPEIRQRLESLVKLAQAVTASLELPEVLDRVARAATELLPDSSSRIWVVEGDRLVLQAAAGTLGPPKSGRKTEFAFGEGLVGQVAIMREPFVSEDVLAYPGVVNVEWMRKEGYVSVVGVPLLVQDRLAGVLFLLTRHRHRFSPEELEILVSFGAQAAIAIENTRRYREAREYGERLKALDEVNRLISSSLRIEEVVENVAAAACRFFEAPQVQIWVADPSGRRFHRAVTVGDPAVGAGDAAELALGEGGVGWVALHREPILWTDLEQDLRIVRRSWALGHGLRYFTAYPLLLEGRVLGVIVMFRPASYPVTPETHALLGSLAGQAAVALENARLFQENQRKLEELSVLYELSQAVTGQLEVARLLQAIHQQVGRVLDARNMVALLYDEERREFEVALQMQWGEPDPAAPLRYSLGAGLITRVVERRQAIRASDYAETCRREGVEPVPASLRFPHWLGVPMIAGDRIVGGLILRSATHPFTEAGEQLLTNIASLAALAVRSARLYEERTRAYNELAAAQDQLVRTEKLRALGEMASGVAHNFNNLLTAILGRTQLLLQTVADPTPRKWLEVIERAALDGAGNIKRIQEFTRIRRDQPFEAVDLNVIVQEALEISRPRWREEPQSKGVTIRVVSSLAPLQPVAGDPGELREALLNLILNAVDAMPDGGTLSFATEARGERVVVTVSDTGVGMSEEVQRRLFDPFFTTKGPHGTGLGLSMTYGIVSRHGGEIAMESAAGKGSTFRLSFPVRRAPAGSGPAPSSVVAPLRCLVVDDEKLVREVLGDLLAAGGHTAVLAGGGAEALARFRAEPFDLVITDLAMPGLNGWEVARAVKQHDRAVPVFLVTGWGAEYSPEELSAHGVDRVFSKPLKLDDILSAVAACGPGRRTQEGLS